jgi:hypothetical protein
MQIWSACSYGTYGLYVECGAKCPRKKGTPIFMCMDNSSTTNNKPNTTCGEW